MENKYNHYGIIDPEEAYKKRINNADAREDALSTGQKNIKGNSGYEEDPDAEWRRKMQENVLKYTGGVPFEFDYNDEDTLDVLERHGLISPRKDNIFSEAWDGIKQKGIQFLASRASTLNEMGIGDGATHKYLQGVLSAHPEWGPPKGYEDPFGSVTGFVRAGAGALVETAGAVGATALGGVLGTAVAPGAGTIAGAIGGATAGIGYSASGLYGDNVKEFRERFKDKGLTENEIKLEALKATAGEAAIEQFLGMVPAGGRLLKQGISREISKGFSRAVGKTVEKYGSEKVNKALAKLAVGGWNVLKEGNEEGLEEVLQTAWHEMIAYNGGDKEGYKENLDLGNLFQQYAGGFAGGSLLGIAGGVRQARGYGKANNTGVMGTSPEQNEVNNEYNAPENKTIVNIDIGGKNHPVEMSTEQRREFMNRTRRGQNSADALSEMGINNASPESVLDNEHPIIDDSVINNNTQETQINIENGEEAPSNHNVINQENSHESEQNIVNPMPTQEEMQKRMADTIVDPTSVVLSAEEEKTKIRIMADGIDEATAVKGIVASRKSVEDNTPAVTGEVTKSGIVIPHLDLSQAMINLKNRKKREQNRGVENVVPNNENTIHNVGTDGQNIIPVSENRLNQTQNTIPEANNENNIIQPTQESIIDVPKPKPTNDLPQSVIDSVRMANRNNREEVSTVSENTDVNENPKKTKIDNEINVNDTFEIINDSGESVRGTIKSIQRRDDDGSPITIITQENNRLKKYSKRLYPGEFGRFVESVMKYKTKNKHKIDDTGKKVDKTKPSLKEEFEAYKAKKELEKKAVKDKEQARSKESDADKKTIVNTTTESNSQVVKTQTYRATNKFTLKDSEGGEDKFELRRMSRTDKNEVISVSGKRNGYVFNYNYKYSKAELKRAIEKINEMDGSNYRVFGDTKENESKPVVKKSENSVKEVKINSDTEHKSGQELAIERVENEFKKYAKVYENRFGNVLNSDNAKLLFTDLGYSPNDNESVRGFHTPAGKFIGHLFDTWIDEKKGEGNNTILYTAGGNGSGKSSMMSLSEKEKYSFIMDSTLMSLEPVKNGIQKALDNGYDVKIQYVYRKPIDAWVHGVLDRVSRGEHITPKNVFANTHSGVFKNVKEISKIFGNKIEIASYENILNNGSYSLIPKTLEEIADKIQSKEEILKEIENYDYNGMEDRGTSRGEHVLRGSELQELTETGRELQQAEGVSQEVHQLGVAGGLEKVVRGGTSQDRKQHGGNAERLKEVRGNESVSRDISNVDGGIHGTSRPNDGALPVDAVSGGYIEVERARPIVDYRGTLPGTHGVQLVDEYDKQSDVREPHGLPVVQSNFDLRVSEDNEYRKSQRKDINGLVKEILQKDINELTEEDRKVLSQYSGVGGLEHSFGALTQYYTRKGTIDAMFNALESTGKRFNNVLEPAVGSGNFVGMRPDLNWTTVDIDKTNYEVVRRLYPRAKNYNISYEAFKGKGYDLIISNVPFLEERGKGSLIDRGDIKALHDYYFVKSLDTCADNGIVAFITSKGVMDKKDPTIRKEIVSKGDIIGAYRLPSGEFAHTGTDVVTDIIFIQKRPEGAAPNASQQKINDSFVESLKSEDGIYLNLYYAMNNGNILADVNVGVNKMYGSKDYEYTGTPDLSKIKIDYHAYETYNRSAIKDVKADEIPRDRDAFIEWAKNNGVKSEIVSELNNDNVFFAEGNDIYMLDKKVEFTDAGGAKIYKKMGNAFANRFNALAKLLSLADTYQATHDVSYADEAKRLIMNYEATFKKHPSKDIQLRQARGFQVDKALWGQFCILFDNEFKPSDVFNEITRHVDSGNILVNSNSTLKERALSVENQNGFVGINNNVMTTEEFNSLIGSGYSVSKIDASGKPSQIQNDIVFYSGMTYDKIHKMESMIESVHDKNIIKQLDAQIKKLNEIKPTPLTFDEIKLTLREPWLQKLYEEETGYKLFNTKINEKTGRFVFSPSYDNELFETYAELDIFANYMNGYSLIERLSNNSGWVEPIGQYKTRLADAENIVISILEKMRSRLSSNKGLKEKIENKYNSQYRSFVPPSYVNMSYLIKDVLQEAESNGIKLRENQISWVMQAIYEGKGINSHDVGGGKTFSAIMLGRVLKKKGIAKKPMYVVPAKTIKNWEKEVKRMFPDAKIVSVYNVKSKDRPAKVAEIANTNADYVLITHEEFNKIKLPADVEGDYISNLLEENFADPTVNGRQLQIQKERGEKIKKLLEAEGREKSITFDKLGVDSIIVDEAHNFKNIGVRGDLVRTKLGIGFGLEEKDGKVVIKSARSYDMRFKTQWIAENNNQNNVFLLTATPATNKPLELYTMLRHLSPKLFNEYGINSDADFASTFFETGDVVMPGASGKISILKKLINFNSLKSLICRYIDYRAMKDMSYIKVPKANFLNHWFDPSQEFLDIHDDIQTRMAIVKSNKSSFKGVKGEDSILSVHTGFRSGSIDPRLYGGDHAKFTVNERSFDSETDKVEFTVNSVYETYSKNKNAGQLIFLDNVGESATKAGRMNKNIHQEIRDELIKRGFESNQIGIIGGGSDIYADGIVKTSMSSNEKKEAIVEAFNNGKLKVVVGTTVSMGEGMNLNKKTTDIYHMDIPYTPGAIQQRNGRGVRYGNENSEVNIHYMFMRNSADLASFQIIASKRGWIDSLWSKSPSDELDVTEEMASDGGVSLRDMYLQLAKNDQERALLTATFMGDDLINLRKNEQQQLSYFRQQEHKFKSDIEEQSQSLIRANEKLKQIVPNEKIKDNKERSEDYEKRLSYYNRILENGKKRLVELKVKLDKKQSEIFESEGNFNKLTDDYKSYVETYLDENGDVNPEKALQAYRLKQVPEESIKFDAIEQYRPFTENGEYFPGPEEWGTAYTSQTGKGIDAIRFLLKKENGFVPGAFKRDDIGEIDIVFGETTPTFKDEGGYGLKHILKRHPDINWEELADCIQNGEYIKDRKKSGRILLHNKKVAIGLNKKGRNFVISAYQTTTSLKGAVGGQTWGTESTAPSGLYNIGEIFEKSSKNRKNSEKTLKNSDVSINKLNDLEQKNILDLVESMVGHRNVKFAEQLFSHDGMRVMGKYKNNLISIANGDIKSMTDTALHETLHNIYDIKLTEEEKSDFETACKNIGITHEEGIEGIVNYYRTHKVGGIGRKILSLAIRLMNRIKILFGSKNGYVMLNNLYEKALKGLYANRVDQAYSGYKNKAEQYRNVIDWAKAVVNAHLDKNNYTEWLSPTRNEKKDISSVDKFLRTISHYSDKVPAMKKIFDSAMGYDTLRHNYTEHIFGDDNGVKNSDFIRMNEFAKHNKEGYEKMKTYLIEHDKDASGYSVKLEKGVFYIVDPSGDVQRSMSFNSDREAFDMAFEMEYSDLLNSGYTNGEAEFVLSFRKIMSREWEMLSQSFGAFRNELQQKGYKEPQEMANLWEKLQSMGNLSGSYFPRIRKQGRFEVWAHKDGMNPILETFDTKYNAIVRKSELSKQGYETDLKKSDAINNDVYGKVDPSALNDMIQNAFHKIGKDIKLEDFGLQGRWQKYHKKDGTYEEHFVIGGNGIKDFNKIFKNLGGQYYEDSWHFVNKNSDFSKIIAHEIAKFKGLEVVDVELLSNTVMKSLADMIRERGSRVHMNSRDGKTGTDVFEGYETDVMRAVTLSASGIAGGTAKTEVHKKMVRALMGMDVDFDTYAEANRSGDFEENTQGYADETARLWDNYSDFVESNRINSRKQPNAYSDSIDYINEFMRNQSPSERVIGVIKGIAALKYLSGISSGLINLTTLATSVPASLHAYCDIKSSRVFPLLTKAMKEYANYGFKPESMSKEDMWLFNEIRRNGWDVPQMNEEAMSVTQTWVGRKWNNVMKVAMFVFSSTEKINRATTIAGAYYGMIENHVGKLTEADRKAYLEKAKFASDRAHGIYGKVNLPSIARGNNIGSQILRMFYMYKTYIHNYLQTMIDLGVNKKDYKALGWMMLSPAIVAGGSATVLPILARAIASVIPGWDEPDDVEDAFYNWVGDNIGDNAETFTRYGVAGLLGLNLKGSMGISIPTGEVPDFKDLGGAVWGLGEDVFDGIGYLSDGQYSKASEELLPRMLAGIPRAIREYNDGVTNSKNAPIFYGDSQLHLSGTGALLRSLTFNPLEISEKTEEQWNERKIEKKYSEWKSDIYSKVRSYVQDPAKTPEAWNEILGEIINFNNRIDRYEYNNIPKITTSSLLNIERMVTKPSRKERIRQMKQDNVKDVKKSNKVVDSKFKFKTKQGV